jgi:hypothetical protein
MDSAAHYDTVAERHATFDAALAEYQRLKAIENARPLGLTLGDEKRLEPVFDAALAETDVAFDAMIVIPVTDGPRVWAKFAAILEHYEVGGFGLDPGVQAQVFAEAKALLTGEGR